MSRTLQLFFRLTLLVGLVGCGNGGVSVGGGANGIGSSSGSAHPSSGSSSGHSGTTGTTSGATTSGTTAATTSGGTAGGSTGTVCTNLQCQVQSCPNSGHTVVSGTILDPAGKNPLYNVVAYIPNSAVQPLPSGVPPGQAGASCASCNALFTGDAMAVALSDDLGHFTIQDAPVGANIPLVVQVGKWRTHITIPSVAACTTTAVGSIAMPSKMDSQDTVINIPDIAVSTGSADSLECLLVRIGIDPSEYVAGTSTAGRIHIFNGGAPSGTHGGGGKPEANRMSGAPASDTDLWNSTTSLANYDLVLLSCEGGETYDAQPANLEAYLNSGGRVFASHFHYAWFSGPLQSSQSYSAPADWNNLATWTGGSNGGSSANGKIVTLLPNGNPFPKGQALAAWLANTSALGTGGAPMGELFIAAPKENASVSASNTPSQAWIDDDSNSSTLYFSFDTPIGGVPTSEGLGAEFCGRAVFSGLHVGGASYDGVNCRSGGGGSGCNSGAVAPNPPPTGCDTSHDLSPQEKALEFMLFDLSSCVVPDTANPADAGIIFK